MASLSDKLKALGVQHGLPADQKPPPAEGRNLERILNGKPFATIAGDTFLIEQFLPYGQPHGKTQLHLAFPLNTISRWAADKRIENIRPQDIAFIDIETTGLSGGAGVLAFLVGVGRYEQTTTGESFHVAQFFLRDPSEESPLLTALEAFLAPCKAIVSFNGKSFDVPILGTRYRLRDGQTSNSPFEGLAHIDLLHLARRLWKERLPNRSLGYLEAHILETTRDQEDIPGWMAPEIYAQYLRFGETDQLHGVLYHNAMDVISLAALLNHMAAILEEPLLFGGQYGIDLLSLARLFESMGDLKAAARLYLDGLEHEDAHSHRIPGKILLDAIHRLASIHKRTGDYQTAIQLWQQATMFNSLPACIELAKYYEHILRDFAQALEWTNRASNILNNYPTNIQDVLFLTIFARNQWQAELDHRMQRLNNKIGL
jgi:uncharacterized protein YprB with RNaseH-like and TPR domain